MKRLLSFDISSATIGWSLFTYNDEEMNLIDYGFIKPPKKEKGSMSFRLNKTFLLIREIILKLKPDEIAVEDYAKAFGKNKSTANTIIVLSTFNETVCLSSFQTLGKDVHRYPVATIRSRLGKLFEVKTVSKEDVFLLINKHATFFKAQLNRNNKIKKEMFDIADSIAVGIAHILTENKNAKRYYL